MPCPGPVHFSHVADYVYDFCPLSDPDVDQICEKYMIREMCSSHRKQGLAYVSVENRVDFSIYHQFPKNQLMIDLIIES